MWSKPDIKAKDAFLLGFDPPQEFLRQPFEVFAVLNSILPACSARSTVDEQYLDVRGVAELSPSEFSQAQDGKGAGFLVGEPWVSIQFLQLGAAIRDAPFHDDLRQLRERERKVREIGRGLDDVFYVDPEQLTVFKLVQGSFSRLVCFGASDQMVEFFPEGRLRLDQGCVPVIREQWKEVVVLAPEKIFPQKVAGAEQSCEQGKGFLIADEVERPVLALLAVVFHDEIQEMVERCKRLGRIGSPGQSMRELFDEYSGQPQLLLIVGVEQLLPIAIPDIETITQFGGAIAFDLGLGNVDVAHGQGIR